MNAGVMTVVDHVTKIGAPLVPALASALHRPAAGFFVSACLSAIGLACLVALKGSGAGGAPCSARAVSKAATPVLLGLLKQSEPLRQVFLVSVVQTAVLGLYDSLLSLFLESRGFPAATFRAVVSVGPRCAGRRSAIPPDFPALHRDRSFVRLPR